MPVCCLVPCNLKAQEKRFEHNGYKVRLLPENPDFEPILIDLRETELVIEGLAVGVIRPDL